MMLGIPQNATTAEMFFNTYSRIFVAPFDVLLCVARHPNPSARMSSDSDPKDQGQEEEGYEDDEKDLGDLHREPRNPPRSYGVRDERDYQEHDGQPEQVYHCYSLTAHL